MSFLDWSLFIGTIVAVIGGWALYLRFAQKRFAWNVINTPCSDINERSDTNKRSDGVGTRPESVDARLAGLANQMSFRFDAMETRFSGMNAEFVEIRADLRAIDRRVQGLEMARAAQA